MTSSSSSWMTSSARRPEAVWGPVSSTAPVNKSGRPRKHPTTAAVADAAAMPAGASTAPPAARAACPRQPRSASRAAVARPSPEGVDAAAAANTTAADQEHAAAAKVLQL